MYLNRERRVAILMPPRTGSRALAAVAVQHGFVDINAHHFTTPAALAASDKRYIMVRHHLDALASWFTQKVRPFPSVAAWVRDWYPRAGTGDDGEARYVCPGAYYGMWMPHATDVVRYEDYDAAVETIFGPGVVARRVTDVTSIRAGRPWQDFYSQADEAYVRGLFAAEMRALGYDSPAEAAQDTLDPCAAIPDFDVPA